VPRWQNTQSHEVRKIEGIMIATAVFNPSYCLTAEILTSPRWHPCSCNLSTNQYQLNVDFTATLVMFFRRKITLCIIEKPVKQLVSKRLVRGLLDTMDFTCNRRTYHGHEAYYHDVRDKILHSNLKVLTLYKA
jgi:hypothetical protein